MRNTRRHGFCFTVKRTLKVTVDVTRFLVLALIGFSGGSVFGAVPFLDLERHIASREKEFKIPKNLLRAISLVESGKTVGNAAVAWPWTINVNGKGYTFKTKRDAVRATKALLAAGQRLIDVGVMQINLKHHPKAFRDLEEAFDPKLNVTYGAKFLKNLHAACGSWDLAVARYHSANPKFHNPYKEKVARALSGLSGARGSRVGRRPPPGGEFETNRVRVNPTIKPYARVRRVYYSLGAREPNLAGQTRAKSNGAGTSGKIYYALD